MENIQEKPLVYSEANVLTFELTPVCIGRSRECELSFSSECGLLRVVSKKHAKLYPCFFNHDQEVRWFLKDLDSKHGTSINDDEMMPGSSSEVFNGDIIYLARQYGENIKIKCYLEGRGNSKIVLETHTPFNEHVSSSSTSAEKRKYEKEYNIKDLFARKKFRLLEEDENRLGLGQSPLKCPICFEYFMDSLTLSCSHTFCGSCLRLWMHESLSCPTCRLAVTQLPVRTRALDELCVQLVDPKNETWIARQQAHQIELQSQNRKAQKIRRHFLEIKSQASGYIVWDLWTSKDKNPFCKKLSSVSGVVREAWCEAVGLTEESISTQSKASLLNAMRNLIAKEDEYRSAFECTEMRNRLRLFLYYG
jgi:hypothetical protein